MNWARDRQTLLEAHMRLENRHHALARESAQLHELREHHENLQAHHDALAAYETALSAGSPLERTQLTLVRTIEATEVMLVETARLVEQAREAWRQATKVYQKVRNMLDREE